MSEGNGIAKDGIAGGGAAPRVSWLRSPRSEGAWIWVESTVITLVAIALGFWIDPADPFFLRAEFPWSWFAAVLLALRYGVLSGILSAAILLAGWYAWVPGHFDAEVPKLYFLGGLLLVMVCGEYSGNWGTRLRRLSELNLYLEDRVERITKRLYLLRLSHDRLEQDLLTRPTTLRDALSDLRRRLALEHRDGPLPGAQVFLDFIAQQCQLEVAAIYHARWDLDRSYERVAQVGEPPALRHDDALLVFARERQKLAHVQTGDMEGKAPTDHLVVAPLVSSDGRGVGMLVVTRMPFFALKEETLQMLAVLLASYADGVVIAERAAPLMRAHPDCPEEFVEEMIKLARIQREFGLVSHIVVLSIDDGPNRQDIYEAVQRSRRTPDVTWGIENRRGRGFVINLMPLAGRAAVEGYVTRTELSLQRGFGGNLGALGVRTHLIPLSEPAPLDAVRRVVEEPAR